MTFDESKALLTLLGWKFSDNGHCFTRVWIPLTPHDWCCLCMREEEGYVYRATGKFDEDGEPLYMQSEYVGGCCGNMSGVQDMLNSWFRDGGCVDAKDLVELGEAMRDHGDVEDLFGLDDSERVVEIAKTFHEHENQAHAKTYRVKAWAKIALMYQLVKDNYLPDIPSAPGFHQGEMSNALHLVGRFGRLYGMLELFEPSKLESPTTFNAQQILLFAKFLPALRLLHARAHEMCPGPVEGWAIVDLSKGEGEIAENRMGLCVYATRTEATKILQLIQEHAEERRVPELKLRPVSISLEKGVEFLDSGAAPALRVDRKRLPHWVTEPVEDIDMMFEQWSKTNGWDSEKSPKEHRAAHAGFQEAALYYSRLLRGA